MSRRSSKKNKKNQKNAMAQRAYRDTTKRDSLLRHVRQKARKVKFTYADKSKQPRMPPQSDLRRSRPIGTPIRKLDGRPATITRQPTNSHKWPSPDRDRFIDPLRVPVCIRRRTRRSVLFARKIAGKGKSGPKKRTYNEFSKVSCK